MLSQRAVSGVRLLGIGSLGLASSVILFLGMFIALLMWAPWWLALRVFDVPTLDVFRIFYASSYTILAPALLFGGAAGFVLSTVIARKSKASKGSIFYVMLSAMFVGLFMAGAFVPAVTAISSTQQAEYNQFNNKPCTYYVFPDTSATVNYYAQNCATGVIDYGGPGNAGGAPGTDAASVLNTTLAAASSSAITVIMADGTYPLGTKSITLPSANPTTFGCITAMYQDSISCKLTYSGSGFPITSHSLSAQSNNIIQLKDFQVTVSGTNYAGGLDAHYTPVELDRVYFVGPGGASIVANSIGILAYPNGNVAVSSGTIGITGFDQCLWIAQDHWVIQDLGTSECKTEAVVHSTYPTIGSLAGINLVIGFWHSGISAVTHPTYELYETDGGTVISRWYHEGTFAGTDLIFVDETKMADQITITQFRNYNTAGFPTIVGGYPNDGKIFILSYYGQPAIATFIYTKTATTNILSLTTPPFNATYIVDASVNIRVCAGCTLRAEIVFTDAENAVQTFDLGWFNSGAGTWSRDMTSVANFGSMAPMLIVCKPSTTLTLKVTIVAGTATYDAGGTIQFAGY